VEEVWSCRNNKFCLPVFGEPTMLVLRPLRKIIDVLSLFLLLGIRKSDKIVEAAPSSSKPINQKNHTKWRAKP
jgi:hypothetical protein